MGPWSKGTTSPWRGGDPGSTPGGSTDTRRDERKVAGYGWPGLGANECARMGVRVRIPCLPLIFPDGEAEDHTSVLTRSPGFESWSGHPIPAALVVKRTIMPRF